MTYASSHLEADDISLRHVDTSIQTREASRVGSFREGLPIQHNVFISVGGIPIKAIVQNQELKGSV